MPSNEVLAERIIRLEADLERESRLRAEDARITEAAISQLRQEIHQQELDRLNQEKKNVLWGAGVLGSAILVLAGIIWKYKSLILLGKN